MRGLLGVIGSAGRAPHASRCTRELYYAAYGTLVTTMEDWQADSIVSGGAPFADHLAVRAFLEGEAVRLVLHLPAAFDGRVFVKTGAAGDADVASANRYHEEFSRRCGLDSRGFQQPADSCSNLNPHSVFC